MERSQIKSVKKGRKSTRVASRSFALLLFCLTVSLSYGKDAPTVRNADATRAQANVEQGVLGEILGLDPAAATPPAAESRNAVAPPPRALKSTAETLDKYQAKLLADRRVGYGNARPFDATTNELSQEEDVDEDLLDYDAPVKETIPSTPPKTSARKDGPSSSPQVSVLNTQYGDRAATAEAQFGKRVDPAGPFNSSAYAKGVVDSDAEIAKKKEESLDLNDVVEYAREGEPYDDSKDDALQEGAIVANEEEDEDGDDETPTVDDECFLALDPYTSLFIEYDPTYEWTESILQDVESILETLAESPSQTRALIDELARKLEDAETIKEKLTEADAREKSRKNPWESQENAPLLSTRYTLAQRVELLDAFKNAMERRVFLWDRAADYFEARERGELLEPAPFDVAEMKLLLSSSLDVQKFFGDTPNGLSWRSSFDVDALVKELEQALELPAQDRGATTASRRVNTKNARDGYLREYAQSSVADRYLDAMSVSLDASQVEFERERRLRFLQDRINAIAYKIEKTPMTESQRALFKKPTLASWASLVLGMAADATNGEALLFAFEHYENVAGSQAGRSLQQLALRMTTSQSEVCRLYGRAVDVIYDNPNVKAYVSEALINRLLPVRDPEFAVVQETILNNPVVGRRRVDTQVSIKLRPDPERLLMDLNISGRVHANTSSAVFSAKLHNESYANYRGVKALEWRDTGIAYSPAVVTAASSNRLNAVETGIDFVPLVGDLARGLTRSQYQSQQTAIEAESEAKIVKETRARFDQESNERFDALNAQLRNGFFKNMSNLGLSLKTQRSRTTDDWLLASMRFGAEYALGCQSTEPPTLQGAFADVKVHESSINSFLGQLDLGGRKMTPRETLDFIADRLNKPGLKDVEIEESELSYAFAKSDPITVRFFEDRICIVLRFDEMTLGKKTWEDIEVQAAYRPTLSEEDRPMLVRDGAIELYGPASVMEQIPIRAVFSKIFQAQRPLELRVPAMAQDERFAGLAIGLCRASRGWFAISMIKDPNFGRERVLQNTYVQ